MTEERRRELLALGFPDDGYDYLLHMRDLGRGRPQQQQKVRGGSGPYGTFVNRVLLRMKDLAGDTQHSGLGWEGQ